MCDDKWQTRKNIVETIAFVLGGLLGTIWLFFSFSADKPLFQTFVSKNLSIGISLEDKGVVDTKPQTYAEDIILDVSNNGKATMSVLSGITMVWGFNYGAKKNADSGIESNILDEDNYLNKVNRRLYLGEPGIILRDYKPESITLLSVSEVMRDGTLEPGEKAKRTDTLLIPCGKYDALFVRVELVSKPTSKKYLVVDDPLSEKWAVYWHFLDEMKPIYFIKDRENWERERNCLIYKNMEDSCCKNILEKFDGADNKYLEKHVVMSDKQIKVAKDRTDRISKRQDVRRYLMTYTKTLPQSSAINCK